MRTTFFNVGHGDAILLELPGSKEYDRHFVLRDFGRSRFAKLTENSCTPKRLIQHRCFCDPWFCFYPFSLLRRLRLHKPDYIRFDVMLSHAHDDHFNGFKLLYDDGLRRIFDNAYIPFLPMGDLNELGGLLIKYSLLMYRYFGPDTIEGENAKNWLLATPIMMALSQKMWCVGQGLNLSDWNCKTTILWPPAQSTQAKETLSKNWKDYLADNN